MCARGRNHPGASARNDSDWPYANWQGMCTCRGWMRGWVQMCLRAHVHGHACVVHRIRPVWLMSRCGANAGEGAMCQFAYSAQSVPGGQGGSACRGCTLRWHVSWCVHPAGIVQHVKPVCTPIFCALNPMCREHPSHAGSRGVGGSVKGFERTHSRLHAQNNYCLLPYKLQIESLHGWAGPSRGG